MATLILEEGGNTRRFRLNQGKVTIGSGESCTLTIADDNVAEVHAELELLKDSATLRLKKGVMHSRWSCQHTYPPAKDVAS